MYISEERPQQTEQRLRQVIASARLENIDGAFAFVESPRASFPADRLGDALALVRDEQVWSALVPSDDPNAERFFVFSFLFTNGLDNSGFVGWLASHLKKALGTGVFVVCGQNSNDGGIFDYWGAPLALRDEVIREVQRLRIAA